MDEKNQMCSSVGTKNKSSNVKGSNINMHATSLDKVKDQNLLRDSMERCIENIPTKVESKYSIVMGSVLGSEPIRITWVLNHITTPKICENQAQ